MTLFPEIVHSCEIRDHILNNTILLHVKMILFKNDVQRKTYIFIQKFYKFFYELAFFNFSSYVFSNDNNKILKYIFYVFLNATIK